MVMKMLEAGGLEALTDGIRKADEDNLGGYYEYELVKKLNEDAAWLDSAPGKSVKVISQLLPDLPADFHYKVLFINRNMEEILASQRQMLKRRGQDEDGVEDSKIAEAFYSHLGSMKSWLASQSCFDVLYINYSEIIKEPESQARRMVQFLGIALDAGLMADVVDERLYRQRNVQAKVKSHGQKRKIGGL